MITGQFSEDDPIAEVVKVHAKGVEASAELPRNLDHLCEIWRTGNSTRREIGLAFSNVEILPIEIEISNAAARWIVDINFDVFCHTIETKELLSDELAGHVFEIPLRKETRTDGGICPLASPTPIVRRKPHSGKRND